ncbi:MAG: hypothetical protein ACLUE7_06410 [Lachnospirales bacterium]
MALSDRKLKILEAIITDYIETAEPIGSRTIAKSMIWVFLQPLSEMK